MTVNPKRTSVLSGVRARPLFSAWVGVVAGFYVIDGVTRLLVGS